MISTAFQKQDDTQAHADTNDLYNGKVTTKNHKYELQYHLSL